MKSMRARMRARPAGVRYIFRRRVRLQRVRPPLRTARTRHGHDSCLAAGQHPDNRSAHYQYMSKAGCLARQSGPSAVEVQRVMGYSLPGASLLQG